MPTEEAVQCVLEGLGTVLYPISEFVLKPYAGIYDEDIEKLDLRVFPKPNENGIFIKFKRDEAGKRWYMDAEAVDTTKHTEEG